jgi:hypothetical protein
MTASQLASALRSTRRAPDIQRLISNFPAESRLKGKENYGTWAKAIHWKLRVYPELLNHLYGTTGDVAPTHPGYDDWKAVDDDALTALYETISSSISNKHFPGPNITTHISSRFIFKAITSEFDGDTRFNRVELAGQIFAAKHDPSKVISEFYTPIFTAVDAFTSTSGFAIPDWLAIDILVYNLDASWKPAHNDIITFSRGKDKDKVTRSEIISILDTYEREILKGIPAVDSLSTPQVGSAHAARTSRFPHPSNRSTSNNYDWLNMKCDPYCCDRCGKRGHSARFCLANMPEDVKDKILKKTGRPSSPRRTRSRSQSSSRSSSPPRGKGKGKGKEKSNFVADEEDYEHPSAHTGFAGYSHGLDSGFTGVHPDDVYHSDSSSESDQDDLDNLDLDDDHRAVLASCWDEENQVYDLSKLTLKADVIC